MRKKKLIGRLRNLYLLEFINVFFLPFVFLTYCFIHNEQAGLNSIAALTLNGIMLLEGSYLWFKLSRQLTVNKTDNWILIYKKLKLVNMGLILLALTIILTHPFNGLYDKVGAIGFTTLAILEHINYFEIQLMYDNKSDIKHLRQFGFKRAKLKTLLAKVK